MRRRSSGSEQVKARHRKPVKPKAIRPRRAVVSGQEREVARLARELNEALEQQTATVEVLRIISSSPGDLDLVFQTILNNAARLCEASFGMLALQENDLWRTVAVTELSAETKWAQWLLAEPRTFGQETALGRLVRSKQLVHIPDLGNDVADARTSPTRAAFLETGARSLLAAPLFKEGEVIGAVAFYRREYRPFTERQIELVKSFAAQAVIAIENARLLNELRQRTTDLTESLEQQTATSEVLRVISSSPGDLQPVFSTMLENATRICGAWFGNLSVPDRSTLRIVVMHNPPPAFAALRQLDPVIDLKRSIAGPVVTTKKVNHVIDLTAEEPYAGSILCENRRRTDRFGRPYAQGR